MAEEIQEVGRVGHKPLKESRTEGQSLGKADKPEKAESGTHADQVSLSSKAKDTPPLPGDGNPDIDAPIPDYGNRQAYALQAAGYNEIQNYRTAEGNVLDGSGQEIISIDHDPGHYAGTTERFRDYLAPGDTTNRVGLTPPKNYLSAIWQIVTRGSTGADQTLSYMEDNNNRENAGKTLTINNVMSGFDWSKHPDRLLDEVREAKANGLTVVIPSCVAGPMNASDPHYQDAVALNRELAEAGAIVVGTSLDPANPHAGADGAQDPQAGQGCIGTPTVRVDTYEHSNAVPIVAHTIALLKQNNPDITNEEIIRCLQAGSADGTLSIPETLEAAGIRR